MPSNKQLAKRKVKSMQGSSMPPQLTIPISVGHTFRFLAGAAGSTQVTPQSLGDLLCLATGTTAAYQLANSVRIRKVEMWGPPASTLAPVTVSCEFNGTGGQTIGPSRVISDTSVGSSRVAHLVAKPPKDSAASLWQSSASTNNLFNIIYPLNCIIDVHYSFTMRENAGVQLVAGAITGATVGTVYLRPLDSVGGSNVVAPISYITI